VRVAGEEKGALKGVELSKEAGLLSSRYKKEGFG